MSKEIVDSYLEWIKHQRVARPLTEEQLGKFLTKIFGKRLRLTIQNPNERYSVTDRPVFGTLKQARAKFEKANKI